ncbi:protein crossbronx-like [Drosophila tropicalis]|uniref:protein crossbronx-like n=1 Tax=Drosophila tropicalis TaxID=46794 RepID=UPI0035ABE3DE
MWRTLRNAQKMALINQGYRVLGEYKLIKQAELKNIYALPSYASGLHWFGVIFIHSGIYAESMFRFSILLPDNFPEDVSLPTVIFQTEVFHPHICPVTKSLDLTPCFREWKKDQHHIWQILKYIQAIFSDPEGSVCVTETPSGDTVTLNEVHNREALNLLSKNRMEYIKRVEESIVFSRKHMYDKPPTNDAHYIVFEPYSADRHEKAMGQLKPSNWHNMVATVSTSLPAKCVARIDSARQLNEEEDKKDVPVNRKNRKEKNLKVTANSRRL